MPTHLQTTAPQNGPEVSGGLVHISEVLPKALEKLQPNHTEQPDSSQTAVERPRFDELSSDQLMMRLMIKDPEIRAKMRASVKRNKKTLTSDEREKLSSAVLKHQNSKNPQVIDNPDQWVKEAWDLLG